MTEMLTLAVPSKGRLMEQTAAVFEAGGLTLRKTGSERGYRGELAGIANVEVLFVSASAIANALRTGEAHLGVTGEDLIREEIIDADTRVVLLKKLGFGQADVVVAAPKCWVDVRHMADLDRVASMFRQTHHRRMRVATKYLNLTRRFFAQHGISDYRIVESLGATEGTPAAGAAELIVDITSTGTTLEANGLKVLADGIILASEANLVASKAAPWTPAIRAIENEVLARLGI